MRRFFPILLLVGFLFSGCGDSSEEFIFNPPPAADTGTLVFNFVQAQTTVPSGTTELVFEFFNNQNISLFTETRAYANQVVFDFVPTSVSRVEVTAYSAEGFPLLIASGEVAVVRGGTVTVPLTSVPITLQSLTPSAPQILVAVGATQQLTFQATFSNGVVLTADPAGLSYSGNNTAVATVVNGLVTGVVPGETSVTASLTVNGTSADAVVSIGVAEAVVPSRAATQVNDVAANDSTIGLSNTSRNIAIDEDAGIHVVFTNDSTGDVRYTRSTDLGATFSSSVSLGTTSDDFSPVIATGVGGFVYVAFHSNSNNDVSFLRSTDGGATFGAPQVITNFTPEADGLSMATFGTNVYLATSAVQFVRSTNNGVSFDAPLNNLFGGGGVAFLDVVVNPITGEVILAADDPTVSYVRSTDGGASFGNLIFPGNPDLFFSEFVITTLNTLIGVQTGDGGPNVVSVTNLLTDTSSSGGTNSNSDDEERAAAVDFFNTVFTTGAFGETCFYETLDPVTGAVTTAAPVNIGSGISPDVAGNPVVGNVGMLFNNGGNIFYFAP